MSEKKVRIHLEKHRWPDEVQERRKRNLRRGIMIAGVLVTFVFGWVVGSTFAGPTVTDTGTFGKLQAIYESMGEDWYFGKDIEDLNTKLIDDAINGMVDGGGDIHTYYMSAEEAKAFTDSMNLGFVGIGVQYYDAEGTYIIERVFRGSPAENAGVLPGDIIYKVNGELMSDIGSDKLAEKVKGEAGTIVKIVFLRAGQEIEKTITRASINNTAYGEMIDADSGLLEISTFGDTTGPEVKAILEDLKKKGATDLILDLRDNGGGYLSTLETIGSFFIEKGGILLQQEFRDGSIQVSKSSGNIVQTWKKIVILVNGNTASAAEVLTAALSENLKDTVTIVGTLTYGKGTVQTQRPFNDQSVLKYTIAQWLTPLGNMINGKGITPDEVVPLETIMENGFSEYPDETKTYAFDSVGEPVKVMQEALRFLGYAVDRTDGYFSQATLNALKAYEATRGTATGILTQDRYNQLNSDVIRVWHQEIKTRDTQMAKAVAILDE